MLEQGLVMLVESEIAPFAPPQTSYLAQLPKDQATPAWTYRFVSIKPNYTLTSARPGLTMRRMEIESFANNAADALNLADAIDNVLSGYRGTLADPDRTVVDSCFQSDLEDFFDEERRSYRRVFEYQLWFFQS